MKFYYHKQKDIRYRKNIVFRQFGFNNKRGNWLAITKYNRLKNKNIPKIRWFLDGDDIPTRPLFRRKIKGYK